MFTEPTMCGVPCFGIKHNGVMIVDTAKRCVDRSSSKRLKSCTLLHFVAMAALYILSFAHAQDCDSSFGTNIAVSDCYVAIQDFAATSVRDEAFTRSPVIRSFNRDREQSTPRNLMPQGFPHKTCAIGFDLAGSSGHPVVDSYKNLINRINDLVQACVIGQDQSKHRGFGGLMRIDGMVFVVTNPKIRAVQQTCLALPKQHVQDLGECVARKSKLKSSHLALASGTVSVGSGTSPQRGFNTPLSLPGPQPASREQSIRQQDQRIRQPAKQKPSYQTPAAAQAAMQWAAQEQQGEVPEVPALQQIRGNFPDLYRQIQQQIEHIEAQEMYAQEQVAEEQLALQQLAQTQILQQRLAQQQLSQQRLAQQRLEQQQLSQQRLAQQRLEQQQIAQQVAQQQIPQQQIARQRLAQQQFGQQHFTQQQPQGQPPINEQQTAQEYQRHRQSSLSPGQRFRPQGDEPRPRPGSEESDVSSLSNPPALPPIMPLNLATQLNSSFPGGAMQPPRNLSADDILEPPRQRQRLSNQTAQPGLPAGISSPEFARMLQEYQSSADNPGPFRGASFPNLTDFLLRGESPAPGELHRAMPPPPRPPNPGQ